MVVVEIFSRIADEIAANLCKGAVTSRVTRYSSEFKVVCYRDDSFTRATVKLVPITSKSRVFRNVINMARGNIQSMYRVTLRFKRYEGGRVVHSKRKLITTHYIVLYQHMGRCDTKVVPDQDTVSRYGSTIGVS